MKKPKYHLGQQVAAKNSTVIVVGVVISMTFAAAGQWEYRIEGTNAVGLKQNVNVNEDAVIYFLRSTDGAWIDPLAKGSFKVS